MAAETLPALLAERAQHSPKGVALRQKRHGIWQEITWSDHLANVRTIAQGLARLGVRPRDVVALIGEHRAEWLASELAIQAAGGIAAPLFADATPSELDNMLRLCEARFAIVEGQEQVDKLLESRDRLPSLERVVYWDPRGMRPYTDPWLRPLWDVTGQPPPVTRVSRSARAMEGQPASAAGGAAPSASAAATVPVVEADLSSLRAGAVAEIIFSPGAGGAVRAARLTHANLVSAARAMVAAEGLNANSEYVSFAPNAWIGDRAFATAAALVAGFTVNLPEDAETVLQDIQEIGPRLVVASPHLWQRLETTLRTRIAGSGRLRRALCRGVTGESGGPRLPRPLAELLIRRPLRDHVGLLHARQAYSTGASLPNETVRFYRAIGVPLKQLYLLTAAAGPTAVGENNMGRALPGVTMRLAADGEVLVQGPGVAGAHPGDTASANLPDGWLSTGDLGSMAGDGTLTLLDRVTNVARLVDGTRVVPAEIERRLVASPYIQYAIVLAADRPYPAALVAIDGSVVGAWAEQKGTSVTTYRELSQLPDVQDLVRQAVQHANAELPAGQRVQRFAILDRELSADDGELTRLRTVRRTTVASRWSDVVNTLYGGGSSPTAGPRIVAMGREPATVT